MSIGDDALSENYPLVPDTGEEGKVRWGSREINRTRDFVALVKKLIPTSKDGFRDAAGFSSGNADPTGGEHGDIYFKTIESEV